MVYDIITGIDYKAKIKRDMTKAVEVLDRGSRKQYILSYDYEFMSNMKESLVECLIEEAARVFNVKQIQFHSPSNTQIELHISK